MNRYVIRKAKGRNEYHLVEDTQAGRNGSDYIVYWTTCFREAVRVARAYNRN